MTVFTISCLISIDIQTKVSYNEILNTVCKVRLEFNEELKLDVSPCSLRKASHDGEPFMALVYNGKVDGIAQFGEFVNNVLKDEQNVLKASCVHLDAHLSENPILLFEPEQPLKDFCVTHEVLSEVDQLTILRDVTVGLHSFLSCTNIRLKVTTESIFVHEDSKGQVKALFSPMYQYSYFPHAKQPPQSSVDYEWVKTALLLMHYRDQCGEHSELPKSHILYNIFKYKWFSDEKIFHPEVTAEIDEEFCYILGKSNKNASHLVSLMLLLSTDLEMTRKGMIDALSSFDVLEVAHLHMILIGHTGVGKTSIRKHLQNIPFNEQEKSTIIMEQELLCQDSTEDSTVSISFKSKSVYMSEPDKIFLTLGDTGGQPMFQHLLPCFAKLRSICGICFRLCDLLESCTALVRPVSSLECERESPYSCVDYIYRCLAFIDSFSSSFHSSFLNIPPEVKNIFFESTNLKTFPRLALIGTFKDTLSVQKHNLKLTERYSELKQSFEFDFQARALLPELTESLVFEIDNTRSGQNEEEDPGMMDLCKQIVACTQSSKIKTPSAWISFKVDLEHESQIQQPCTGIITFETATEIAKKYEIDPKPALCYFHELGVFLWYHEIDSLKEYVIVELRNLVSILGTIFNPEQFITSPERRKTLQTRGIINTEKANQMLDCSRTGLPFEWVFSFFKENHLAVSLNEGYFIPSMLQVLPICSNHLHICDVENSVCTSLPHNDDTEVAPLFFVSKSKCIPPGFFPRLMTMLAGIQNGRVVWKLFPSTSTCKYRVSFVVNEQACISFTEFLQCIRVQLEFFSGAIISRKLCNNIMSQLKVQLQRAFPQVSVLPISVTFACYCSKFPHFLLSIPSTTKDTIHCSEHITFEAPKSCGVLLKSPLEISSEKGQFNLVNCNYYNIIMKFLPYFSDAERLFETALNHGLVNLQVSTVVFVRNEDSSYTEMLFGEPTIISNYSSNFYFVDGKEILILKQFLDDFLACNAMVPQGATFEREIFDSQSSTPGINEISPQVSTNKSPQKASSGQSSNSKKEKENTPPPQELVYEEFDATSKDVISEPEIPSIISKETSFDQIIYRQRPVEGNSQVMSSKSTSTISSMFKETLGKILKLMYEVMKEKRSLQFIHAIECNNTNILPILPLILQCTINFGVGYTKIEAAKILEAAKHLSKKWLIIKTEETKAFISHKTLFEIDVSFQSQISIQDLVQLSDKTEGKAIPYAWYYLCHAIQNAFKEIKRKVMSIEKVSDIAKRCHISVDELPKILSYLHKTGLLLYYGDILPNVLFEDASLIVKILSTAILNPQNNGIVHESSLRQVDNVFVDDLFTFEDAINLLRNLAIISSINKQLFCMPTLLRTVIDEKYLSMQGNIPPLHLQYPAAPGVFEYLLCYLTSKQNEILWPWKIHTKTNKTEPSLYKNCAELVLPGYDCIIMLLQLSDCIKVYLQFVDCQPPYAKIRDSVTRGVKKATTSYNYPDVEIKLGFSCTCSSVDFEHTMIYHKQDQWLKCACNSNREAFPLTHNQKVWLEEGMLCIYLHNSC